MRRLLAASGLALLSTIALAGPQQIGSRELSGRENRFIEIPAGRAQPGFRAVAPGKRVAFDAAGVRIGLSGPGLEKSAGGAATLRFEFAGGAKVAPEGLWRSETAYNWLVGDRSEWMTGLRSFGGLAYRGVWPGVDAVFLGDAGGLKYQFELAAGADPRGVALVVSGADDVHVDEAGNLAWRVGGETVVDASPVAYQLEGQAQVNVPAAFRVEALGGRQWKIGFTLGAYDPSKALVIDPAWTGFTGLVGGNAQDQVYAVARDASGNTFACGSTRSSGLPGASGTYRGDDDAFVVKFSASGAAQFVTYVGGTRFDGCHGVALDSSGRIYLAGATTSTDFPTAGSDGTSRFRRTKSTDRDAFVMRLAANGSTVDYSGFIGGSEDDQANAIAVDANGRAYVTGFSVCTVTSAPGCTNATLPFPAFTGPRLTHGGDVLGTGGMDAFVARVDASGGTLEYAGFIGGDGGMEMGNAIAVGGDFTAYVAGATDSAAGLASPGGFRTTPNARPADASDGFVAKVAADGSGLAYFTLLTGTAPAASETGADRAFAIALESDGSVIVAGETDSPNFPANSSGVRQGTGPQTTRGGGMDGFVLRLNAAGTGIDSATYIGGSLYDSAEAVATDGTSLYVTGTTAGGTGFPTVAANGLAATSRGGQDAFLAKIVRGTPAAFAYSGFVGTAASDTLRALAATSVGANVILSAGGATTVASTTGLANPTTGAMASMGTSTGLVLRIDPFGPPNSIAVQSGGGQSTKILTEFANPVTVLVRDLDLLPLAGVPVTFTAPATGASSRVSSTTPVAGGATNTVTISTDASGLATVYAAANGTAGGYSVAVSATMPTGSASGTVSLTNLKGDQTISFGSLADRTMLQTPFTVSATASSSLAVTFSSTTTGVCTVSGAQVTLVSAGTCTIAADQAGDTNWNAAPQVTQSFTVSTAPQTITFGTLADRTTLQTPFTVSATASSSLAVTFSSTTTGVCTVSGAQVTILTAGTCTIAADQGGDGVYAPAPQVARSFAVTKATQTITFDPLGDRTMLQTPFTVSATASSTLAVSFSSATTSVCTVSGAQVTLVAAGTCTIAADQAGNDTYQPAPQVARSFTVSRATQSITFGTLADRTMLQTPFTVSASASSSLAVAFSSTTTGVCTVSGTQVTLVAAGTCTIAADQGGDGVYAPAPQVARSFQVTQVAQAITFGPLADHSAIDPPFTVAATASSGLAVAFSSTTTTVCTVSGTQVTLVGGGQCTVAANQGGSAVYAPAPQVTQSFNVTKASQAISFGVLPDRTFGDAPFTVSATGGASGNPVTFSSLTAACSVSGSTVTIAAAGTCTIAADQAGSALYDPAPQVTRSFAVARSAQSIGFGPLSGRTLGAAPFGISATATSGLAVTFSTATTSVCTVAGTTVTLVSTGTCTIDADQGGDTNYLAAPRVSQSFVVSPGPSSLTVASTGTGTGRVTSSPAGIDCGTACSASYADATVVTLTATGSAGSAFAGWSGACTGTGACQVTMTAARSVTARFDLRPVLADTNGDRKADLFWREAAPLPGVSWWTMNGAAATGGNFINVASDWSIARVADLDGNGRADIVWRHDPTNAYYLWRLDGLAPVGFADLGTPVGPWTLVGTGDLDGDGKADLVWRHTDGSVYVWFMDGGTIRSHGPVGSPGAAWIVAGVADLNDDGRADLVFRNTVDGQVFVWMMNGYAVTASGATGALDPTAWTLRAVADFDGDGKADYLWVSSTGEAWIWLMNGMAVRTSVNIGTPGAGYTVQAVADLDGDGRADIVWRHADNTGAGIYWRMVGTTVAATAPVNNPGGTWRIVGP